MHARTQTTAMLPYLLWTVLFYHKNIHSFFFTPGKNQGNGSRAQLWRPVFPVAYLVLKAGDGEVQQLQQTVDLQHRQVRHPALQERGVHILQHPEEAHQQSPAALCRQRAALTPRLATERETHYYTGEDINVLMTA